MDNSVNPEKLKKAHIASSCFMGLGQILYLKEYIRGALFALVEVVVLCCIIFGAKSIIPANKSEYDYMRGIPDTEEMTLFLENAGYKNLDKILNSKEKDLKNFFNTLSKNKKIIEFYGEDYYADLDFEDYYSMEDAIYDLENVEDFNYEHAQDKFFAIIEKYDQKLAVAMSKIASKNFNKGYKSILPEYKEKLAAAKVSYKDALASIKVEKETAQVARKAVYDEEYKASAGEEKSVRREITVHYRVDASRIDSEFEDKQLKARFAYEKDVKDAFSDFEGLNEFDENYDGCDLCRRSAAKGKRSMHHRAWFKGPIVSSIAGLFSLGVRQNTSVTKYLDHSVFMMIDGIFCLVIIAFFVILYIINVNGAKKAAEKIIKNNKFPTMKESKNDISQNSFATLGIAPAVIMICIFSLVPLLFSALVAFTNYSSPDHIPPNNLVSWVGLENFVTMFSTKIGGGEWVGSFTNAAIWTIVWAVFATFTCFFVGFFYAFVLQDKRVVIPKFFRTIYILPYAIPTMLSLFVWANLLNGTIGPINRTLQLLGLIEQPIPWLSNPWVAKGSLIFVNIWIGFPYSMILTTSSMTAISNSLYEAAVIDGATKWQQFKSITYPLVMFQLTPTLIMQFAGNINNFGAVFFLTGGGPNLPQTGFTTTTQCGATDLLISWIYKLTMNTPARYQLASVLSLLVFVVLVPFALYSFTRTKSFKEGEV